MGKGDPPYSCDCVCETLTMPTNGTTVMSKRPLVKGRVYTITVRGTYDMGGAGADAGYLFKSNGAFDKCSEGSDIGVAINDRLRRAAAPRD